MRARGRTSNAGKARQAAGSTRTDGSSPTRGSSAASSSGFGQRRRGQRVELPLPSITAASQDQGAELEDASGLLFFYSW